MAGQDIEAGIVLRARDARLTFAPATIIAVDLSRDETSVYPCRKEFKLGISRSLYGVRNEVLQVEKPFPKANLAWRQGSVPYLAKQFFIWPPGISMQVVVHILAVRVDHAVFDGGKGVAEYFRCCLVSANHVFGDDDSAERD